MSTAFDSAPPTSSRIARKVWREISRPVRRLSRRVHESRTARIQSQILAQQAVPTPAAAPAAPVLPEFDPTIATVEAEAIPFIQRLVRDSRKHPGPIIEIGTLLGVTTTHMALAKAPEQRIITVDNYCWNPWFVSPAIHEAHTKQMLSYLVQTGHVERVTIDKDEFFRTYRGPAPSMVFLDAMHDYENTKIDIQWAKGVGAKIISGHDYCEKHPGVIQIVDEMGGPQELCSSVWVL